MIKALLGIAGASWLVWQWQKSRDARDAGARVVQHPRALTDWESEGGALHDTGAQLTSPAAPEEARAPTGLPAGQPV